MNSYFFGGHLYRKSGHYRYVWIECADESLEIAFSNIQYFTAGLSIFGCTFQIDSIFTSKPANYAESVAIKINKIGIEILPSPFISAEGFTAWLYEQR